MSRHNYRAINSACTYTCIRYIWARAAPCITCAAYPSVNGVSLINLRIRKRLLIKLIVTFWIQYVTEKGGAELCTLYVCRSQTGPW